ncbi:MAG: metallophosphoesterase [Nocardioides sp.]|uniref:metallophosphoesterase n=1 Tax=Nocardioides sp. TaxID=35761 RepID=UPI003263B535
MRTDSAGPAHFRPLTAIALLLGLAAAMLSTGAFISPASTQPVVPKPKPSAGALTPPTLSPPDGAWLEGRQAVASAPTTVDDSVASLWVDDSEVDANATVGTSKFRFDVGTNSIERRYGNHLLVNGEHRIDLPDLVDERATLEIPNDELVRGENTIEIVTGTIASDCGTNHDDFALSNLSLELLGEVADGEENDYTYSMGDGSCGSNTALLKRATLTFFILGDPVGTTGLATDLDTSTLTNGAHLLTAITESGAQTEHGFTVNNAPAGAPRLMPADGSLVSGEVPVLASFLAGTQGGVDSVTVDGSPLAISPTLGHGAAAFSFNVGTNSIEAKYHSYVLVNGVKSDIGGDFVSQRVDVMFPNDRLVPGMNRIKVVTGATAATCGQNRDDFTISKLALAPASGTATGQDLKASYSMGDGNCGSSTTAQREIDLIFNLDSPQGGVKATLDTTALVDGEHTLAATSTTGQTATRLIVVDNTAPEVASSTPAAGSTITSAVSLAVELADASEVEGAATYTLDGQPIELGAPVGPGLATGDHLITARATDSLGNEATREIRFRSAGIPDVPIDLAPASGSTDIGDSATLSAKVAEPGGGRTTAVFSQAEILTPNQGWQGTTGTMPTTLRVPGEQRIGSTKVLAPGDAGTLPSAAATDLAYQRFDVPIKGKVTAPVLRWEGAIDPARRVVLNAWNVRAGSWDPVAGARGAAETATVLTATVDERYLDGQFVHVLITGEDPFADDIDARDMVGFDDPAGYDFSLVHYTDTQYLSEGAVEQETPEERAVWEKAYGDVTRWVAANAKDRKIAYVAHTGDIIENNIRLPATPELERQVVGEMELSSSQQQVLDDAGIANGVIAGNHDNQSGTEDGPEAIYNRYYGPDRYAAAARRWQNASYGGPWRDGDNQNHFDLFSAGGLDFVVVGLSYGVTRDEAEWADEIFKRFPGRNGILLSHDYLKPSTSPDGRGATFSAPDGAMLFNTIVADNPNVFLILAGHEHGVGTNVKPQVGDIGNGVVELLADYQFYTVSADRLGLTEAGGYSPTDQLRFGASFFRMLQFDVDRGEMSVDTYSPLLDDFGATEFDIDRRYNGQEDTMVLPVDLTSRTTSFVTDSVAVYAPTAVIGEATVPSGQVASVAWAGLKKGTAYAWVVTARSAGGGVTTSTPSIFATLDANGRPVRIHDLVLAR